MLASKMYENLAADRRADTIAHANAVGIGFGGDQAYRAWLADQAATTAPAAQSAPGPGAPGAAEQRATIARLQTLFAHQPQAGLRNAIRRKPD